MNNVRRFRWPALLVLGLSVLALSACGTTMDNTTDDTTNDNAEGMVAGANQQLVYGYIIEVNEQARTVLVDEFDLVSANDTEQIKFLSLDQNQDFINGYYINDNVRVKRLYPLATTANLKISDYDYSGSTYYNQRWGTVLRGEAEGNAVTNNGTATTDTTTNNNTLTTPNASAGQLMTDDSNNETARGDTASASKMPAYYVGSDYQMLRDRMTKYEHVPFMLTLENGKVVKIEEIDYLYYANE